MSNTNGNKRWEPERYTGSKDVRIAAMQKLIDWGNCNLNKPLQILDIGCGNGIADQYLCTTYPKITLLATDKDTAMIDAAQKKNYLPNLEFLQLDALNINFELKYDLVLSTACLHWIKEQEIVLNNIYRALKPNGQAIIISINKQLLLVSSMQTGTVFCCRIFYMAYA
jgi:trans-aconitate methyltransferase